MLTWKGKCGLILTRFLSLVFSPPLGLSQEEGHHSIHHLKTVDDRISRPVAKLVAVSAEFSLSLSLRVSWTCVVCLLNFGIHNSICFLLLIEYWFSQTVLWARNLAFLERKNPTIYNNKLEQVSIYKSADDDKLSQYYIQLYFYFMNFKFEMSV